MTPIKSIDLFNGTSNVTLEDVWGSEGRIIDTARISASDRRVEGQSLVTKDINLLEELWDQQHGTPFETMYFRYRITMPIAQARHFVKHRISSWNEMSKRYRGGISYFYVPSQEACTVDGFELFTDDDFIDYFEAISKINEIRRIGLETTYKRIEDARNDGVLPPDTKDGRDPYRARARELWRNLQTVSENTEIIWTINYRSLANLFNLRLSEHAQYETRKIAEAMYDCFAEAYPLLADISNFE